MVHALCLEHQRPAPMSRLTSQGHHTQHYYLYLLPVIQLSHHFDFLATSVFPLLHVRPVVNFVYLFNFFDVSELGNILLTEFNSSPFDGI